MAIDIILEGTIKALTPISIKRPGQTSQQGVPTIKALYTGGALDVPYIPGETFKGLLRSTSADLATRTIGQLGLHEYFLLHKGGIKDDGKEPIPDVVAIGKFRRSNPVLGLYGAAAPQWLGSSLSVGPALPEHAGSAAIATSDGVRRDDFRLDPERMHLLDPQSREDYAVYVQGVRDKGAVALDIKKLAADLKKAKASVDPAEVAKVPEMQERLNDLQAEQDTIKKGSQVGNTVGRPLDDKFSIAPGSSFNQRIEIFRGEDAEAGLLLATLETLAEQCRIGGMRSIGYGNFSADWKIKIRDGQERRFTDAGTVSISPQSFELKSEHPAIARVLEAWNARAENPDSISVKDYSAKLERTGA